MAIKDDVDAQSTLPRCACGHTCVMHDRFGKGACDRCPGCSEFQKSEDS